MESAESFYQRVLESCRKAQERGVKIVAGTWSRIDDGIECRCALASEPNWNPPPVSDYYFYIRYTASFWGILFSEADAFITGFDGKEVSEKIISRAPSRETAFYNAGKRLRAELGIG